MAREGRLAKHLSARLSDMGAIEAIEQPKNRLKVIEGGKGATTMEALDRLEHGKPVRQHIREFGAVMALVMVIIAWFQIGKPGAVSLIFGLLVAGCLTWLVGAVAPKILQKPWEAWMSLAHVMGFVMTWVILTLTWGLMVIPIGAILRLLGVKVMNVTFKAPVESYWEVRDQKYSDFKFLERQY